MDVTASGLAVVSLALQLGHSAREIQRFLRDVSDAPKELQRVVDLLEQLELIFQQIAMLVKNQQDVRFGETAISTNVLRVIKTCESKLALLESVIEATKKASSASNRATRTLGSVKLVCKKNEIQGFENHLNDAVNLLTLTMMAHLTYVHSQGMAQLQNQVSVTNQTATTITQELVHIRTGMAKSPAGNCNKIGVVLRDYAQGHGQSTRSTLSRNQLTISRTHASLFGKLIVRRIAHSANFNSRAAQSSSETHTIDESNWVFMPSFLSTCVVFRYLSTCGNIQRSIRTYPIIPDDHHIWDICKHGNVQSFQKLLSERQISPFSINTQGETLLHRAAGYYNANVCEVLFEVGLTGEEVDAYGNSPQRPRRVLVPYPGQIIQQFERTYQLFTSRVDDVHPGLLGRALLHNWVFLKENVLLVKKIVTEFISKANIDSFIPSQIPMVMKVLSECQLNDRNRNTWKQVARRLISLKIDNLHFSNLSGYTLLGEVMDAVDFPFESLSLGREFLDVLSELEVDVLDYLQTESEHHFDPSKSLPMLKKFRNDIGERYMVISTSPPSVSWEWFIDPEGPAFELLDWFKNLAFEPWRYRGKISPPFILYETECWPFCLSDWHTSVILLQRGRTLDSKESDLRIFNDRIERRQRKKSLKLAKSQGIFHRDPKVPGAWID